MSEAQKKNNLNNNYGISPTNCVTKWMPMNFKGYRSHERKTKPKGTWECLQAIDRQNKGVREQLSGWDGVIINYNLC